MREYIYTLKSDLLKRVVTEYIDYITNPLNKHRQSNDYFISQMFSGGKSSTPTPMPLKVDKYTGKTLIWNLPRPSYNNAEAKVRMIVDILFRRYLGSSNEVFTLKSSALRRVTVRYKYILDVLRWNFIIGYSHTYTEDNNYSKTLYNVYDPKMFHLIKVDSSIKKEVERFDKWSHMRQRERTIEIIQATSPQFVERYNASLSQLRIDEASAMEYIITHYGENTHSSLSRMYTVKKISQKQRLFLSSTDNNGRLYHIGTELQRDIKRFTNIKYTIDCKNSHPYLLTNIILKYIIDDKATRTGDNLCEETHNTLMYNLTQYLNIHKGTYVHNEFLSYICNILEKSNLRKQKTAKILTLTKRFANIKPDVWQYIYDASNGKVWDNFVEQFNEERSTVKQQIFASVVYSYAKRRNKKKEAEDKWLRAFIERYPTVYDIIVQIKRTLHKQCKENGLVRNLKHPLKFPINGSQTIEISTKDKVLLPTLMMGLESSIFIEVLKRLFNKRITCFGIHDAVAVINPKKMTIEDIKAIILDVYKGYGMMPTLSVEYYGDK